MSPARPRHSVTYRDDERAVWTVEVDFGDGVSPFRETLAWLAAGVLVAGGESRVYALDLATGATRAVLEVPSYFGHLALLGEGDDERLYVLGWRDVHAIDRELSARWVARDVAVDGITAVGVDGGVLTVRAEMDPPGGWFEVRLDAASGEELARTPAFTADYDGHLRR